MRGRAGTLAGVGAVALVLVGAATASAPGNQVRLTPLASVGFPDRAFIVATDTPLALDSGGVRVLENGQLVSSVSVVPASASSGSTFGVVLVIDASDSMSGGSLRHALAAARVFAAHKTPAEAVGVMTFNSGSRVLAPPTTDLHAVDGALVATPRLAAGTHLYDAGAQAVALLAKSKIAAGSVVLLTDGSDTGSRASAQELVRRARLAGVRLFAVGLRSKQFRPAALRALATGTGGTYTEASSTASLAPIYRLLSRRLASEHLLRYRSNAAPGTKVDVEVSIAGVEAPARWSYNTPGLPTTGKPFHRSAVARFVSASGSALVISLVAALLVAFAVSTALRARRGDLTQRIDAFVTAGPALPIEGDAEHGGSTVATLEAIERALAGRPWWDTFKDDVEIAGISASPAALLVGAVVGMLLGAPLLASISPLLSVFVLLIPVVLRGWVTGRLKDTRLKFADQLPDNLLVMAASLRAGHSFVGSLAAVLEEAEEPSRGELQRAVADERLGIPVEDALIRVSRRMANTDLEQVALVAALQRETGGNTAEVLDTVVATVRERFEVRRLVETLTAQGRLSKWILTFLPLGVVGLVALSNPSYIGPLFTTGTGHILLAIAIALQVLGFIVIQRILDVEV